MQIGHDPNSGRYFSRDDDGTVTEIDAGQYARYQTAMETSPLEAGLVGMGKVMSNLPFMDKIFGEMPADDSAYQALSEVSPVATTVGEVAPSLVGPLKAGMVGQAVYGGLSGAGLSEDRLSGGMLGAGGAFMGDMAGRIVGRISNAVRQPSEAAAGKVQRELLEGGYELTPAQKTGNEFQQRLERRLEKTVLGGRVKDEMGAANELTLLQRANEAIGLEGANPLDRNMRELAAEQIGGRMDEAAAGVTLDVPETLAARVSRIIKNDDMLEIPELPAGGSISGTDYTRIRSDLARAQRSAQGSAQDYIGNTIKQMDDLFLENAGPDAAQQYRVAREHYKNLMQLEKGQALTSEGLVNPKSLRNAIKSKQGYGARGVQNTLPETQALIRDVDNLTARGINPQIGQSGTAEGLESMLSPRNWLEGLLGQQYYQRGGGLSGLLTPSQLPPGVGAAAGRGLLYDE